MARKPRKQAASASDTVTTTGAFVFGDPVPFDSLPPKEISEPGYWQIENMEANTMIEVSGAPIEAMKTLAKKVVKNNKGRKYDFRSIDAENPGAGTRVYRIA